MKRWRWAALVICAAVLAGGFFACPRPQPGPKIVLVGMDAITWDLLDPLLQQGRMPHLKSLIDRGSSARLITLRSSYISAVIWTSILTGKLPRKHGVNGWFSTRGFVMNSTNRTTAFLPWMLGEEGITTAALGFWATWPAESINGWIVSDLASYGRFKDSSADRNQRVHDYSYLREIGRVTYPEDLVDQILPVMLAPNQIPREVYQSVLPMSDEEWKKFRSIEKVEREDHLALLKLAVATDYNFHRAGLEIIRRHRPQAYLVYFEGPDIVEHFFWMYMEPEHFPREVPRDPGELRHVIPRYYELMDRFLGEILEAAGPDALVVVCSDHGMKRVDFIGQDSTHSGEHRLSKPPGVLVMAGPHIKAGSRVEVAVVTDLVPTILYLSGLPVGADMDGKVLIDAIEPAYLEANPVRKIKSWDGRWRRPQEETSPLDRDVKEKLRALGYLDH